MKKTLVALFTLVALSIGAQSFAACGCSRSLPNFYGYNNMSSSSCGCGSACPIAQPCCPIAQPCCPKPCCPTLAPSCPCPACPIAQPCCPVAQPCCPAAPVTDCDCCD